MSNSTNKAYYYSTINKTCFWANLIYLIVRVLYLILFLVSKLWIVAIIDGVTILIYGACFLLIKNKKYYPYALICGNEYFVFVSVMSSMLGFNTGFFFYIIGLCVVSFFTTYFSKGKNVKGSIVWVGLSLIIFLVLFFVGQFNAPYYAIEKWLEITLFALHGIGVFAFMTVYLVVFIKYAVSLEKRIMSDSRTDELTQISNRYGLFDYLENEGDTSSLMLALFDIDDFKNINDGYGHVAGDFILKSVAQKTVELLSDSFVCRYGGEEFVVVLKGNNSKSFYERLENFRKAIEKEVFEFNKQKIKITITIGAVNSSKDMTLEKWIELADKKMYSGKNSGKNQTVI